MNAETTPADEVLAANAQDREQLLADLQRAAAKDPKYVVVRQYNHLLDSPVCGHRFGWVAQLCVHRRERQHAHEAGGHYTVRQASA